MNRTTSVATYWLALFLFWEKMVVCASTILPTSWLRMIAPIREYVRWVNIATVNNTPHYAFSFSCSLLE